MIAGGMEAAKKYEGGMEDWYGTEGSIDPEVIAEKSRIDARIVNAINNDLFARKAFNFVQDYVVGNSFKLISKPVISVMPAEYDEEWSATFQKEAEGLFQLWANSDNNWVDYSRHNNLSQLLQLALANFYTTGECFIKVEWAEDPKLPYQTQFQILNGRRISTPMGKTEGQDGIRAGMKFGKNGAVETYYVRSVIEGEDSRDPADQYTWISVPARTIFGRLNMIHILKKDYPGQTRGISQLVSGLMTMRMLKDFDRFAITQGAIQASIAATVESDLPPSEVQQMLGAGDKGKGWLSKYSTQYFDVVKSWLGTNTQKFEINKSKIVHLVPGTKLNMNAMGSGAGIGVDFPTRFLRHLAVALGISYEQLSNDYTRTNYSSAKAAMNETHRTMSGIKKVVADKFAGAAFKLFVEEALHKGDIPCMKGRKFDLYSGIFFDALTNCVWIGPGRPPIDPLKEAQADAELLRLGMTTREKIAAKYGADWRDDADQLEIEKKLYEKKGLTHDKRLDNDSKLSVEEDPADYDTPEDETKKKPKPQKKEENNGQK